MSERNMVVERPRAADGLEGQSHPGPKTILMHVQDDGSVDARLDCALALARASSAHLQCLHVTPIEAYVAFDSFGGVFVMNDIIKTVEEHEASLRSRIEEKLGREDVTWEYWQVTGNVPSKVIGYAALADLVIAGRSPHRSDFVGPATSFLGDLICRMRTPLFIPADAGAVPDVTGPAMIAWDGSYEAANAVRSSTELLKLCSSVHVTRVTEDKEEQFPGTQLLEYLSRHGIHAELSIENAPEGVGRDELAAMLTGKAKSLGAAYIVMGGYNHSRIGEYVFGGVTRSLLGASDVALLIDR